MQYLARCLVLHVVRRMPCDVLSYVAMTCFSVDSVCGIVFDLLEHNSTTLGLRLVPCAALLLIRWNTIVGNRRDTPMARLGFAFSEMSSIFITWLW